MDLNNINVSQLLNADKANKEQEVTTLVGTFLANLNPLLNSEGKHGLDHDQQVALLEKFDEIVKAVARGEVPNFAPSASSAPKGALTAPATSSNSELEALRSENRELEDVIEIILDVVGVDEVALTGDRDVDMKAIHKAIEKSIKDLTEGKLEAERKASDLESKNQQLTSDLDAAKKEPNKELEKANAEIERLKAELKAAESATKVLPAADTVSKEEVIKTAKKLLDSAKAPSVGSNAKVKMKDFDTFATEINKLVGKDVLSTFSNEAATA